MNAGQGDPHMRVANLNLKGIVVALPKPLLVCLKRTSSQIACSAEAVVAPSEAKLEVMGFVTRKILFKSRPHPIVTSLKRERGNG